MQQLVLKPAGEPRCVGRVPDGEMNRGLMGYSWGGIGEVIREVVREGIREIIREAVREETREVTREVIREVIRRSLGRSSEGH